MKPIRHGSNDPWAQAFATFTFIDQPVTLASRYPSTMRQLVRINPYAEPGFWRIKSLKEPSA